MTTHQSYLVAEAPTERSSLLKDVTIVLGASVIISLFAGVSIPLFFTPVPIATQPHVVLLLAMLLGSTRGSLAVLSFLFQGVIGLPVFAGGASGPLVGPSSGYLLGYLAAAFVTGYIAERMKNRTVSKALFAMGIGNAVIYAFGLPWLAHFLGWQRAFLLGMAPFLCGDLLKLMIATRALKVFRFFRA